MVQRRGQSGIEFLAVTGIGMVLLLAVSFVLLADSRSSRDTAEMRQVQQVANELLAQARIVQAQGRNSWVTVEGTIPESVSAIYTVEDDTLVFDMNTAHGPFSQPIFSLVPIAGNTTIGAKKYLYNPAARSPGGNQRFIVTANGTAAVLRMQ
jgi:type II secretory pathway pseudopilin PulG